ncbi:hypothetical protein [Actinoallomurus sp. NPDC050550]|uniref:hypothetical protein n=1 Tax=Actinoallomurus sp. NPDC050550 TaxID=3154937 RepID=UPI00340F7F29
MELLALLVLGAAVSAVRLYRVRSTLGNPLGRGLGATVAGAGAGLLLAPPVDRAAATAAAMVVLGVACGTIWPETLFGVSMGAAFAGLPPRWSALPVLAASLAYAGVAVRHTDWWRHRMAGRAYLRSGRMALRAIRQGKGQGAAYLDPPSPPERLPLPIFWLAGLVPLGLGLAAGGAWRALTGLLVSLAFLLNLPGLRGMTRKYRNTLLLSMPIRGVVIVLAAAGPIGAWVAEVGSFPVAPSLRVPVGVVLVPVGMAVAAWFDSGERKGGLVRWLLAGGVLSGIADDGLFFFLCGGVFHDVPALLAVGAVLAVLWILLRCRNWLSNSRPLLMGNVATFGSGWGGITDVEGWVYDWVLTRPKRPDLSLLQAIVDHSVRAPHGGAHFMHDLVGVDRGSLRVRHSLQWLDFVDYLVGRIEEDVLPEFEPPDAARLASGLAGIRVIAWGARANLYQYVNLREEAAAAYRRSVEIAEAAGLSDLAAFSRVALALVLGARLRRPAEAMSLLETVLDDEGVASMIRRRGCQVAMVISREFGDEAAVVAYRRRRDLLSATPADYARLLARDPGTGRSGPLANRKIGRWMMKLMENQELFFDASSPEGTEPLPPAPGGFAVPERELLSAGRLLAHQGKTRRALSVLEDAARLAEQQGHTEWLLRSRNDIATLHLERGDRSKAWLNLMAAIEAHQHIRSLALDPAIRGDVGGLFSETFERAIELLVTARPRPSGEWPSRPAATAFDLSELARSRVFLELLGERLPPLSEEEAAAQTRLSEARQRLAAAPEAERGERLTEVRDAARELERYYDRSLPEGPHMAEHVALRRGTPVPYEEIRRLLADSAP